MNLWQQAFYFLSHAVVTIAAWDELVENELALMHRKSEVKPRIAHPTSVSTSVNPASEQS